MTKKSLPRALATLCLLLFSLSTLAEGPPTIVFMTDFGDIDDSVAICKGVMTAIEPHTRIIDITHKVQPYSIPDAARFLSGTIPYYGPDTIFIVVVDPGVGSSRKPIIAKSRKGQYFVLPDNGLITMVEDLDGIEEVREISNPQWMLGKGLSSTFHGRDIFAPAAGHLANGKDWKKAGPPLSNHVRLEMTRARMNEGNITGEVIGLDGPYGNLITNISGDLFQSLNYSRNDAIRARIGDREFEFPLVRTFSDVPQQKELFYIDSRGRLGLAINMGNFAEVHKITPPVPIVIYGKQ